MAVDHIFVKALPKSELHAHLSGSISPDVLHDLWLDRGAGDTVLQDPKTALAPAGGIDVVSFFPLFDKYIYQLVNDADAVEHITRSVLEDFQNDGVSYLELRTTPRQNLDTGLTKNVYVSTVNQEVARWNARQANNVKYHMEARLILSVDRKMSKAEAEEVIDLAIQHKHDPSQPDAPKCVVGIDLCGNPGRGDVSTYTHAMERAKAYDLGITAHFAEVPMQTTPDELDTILSWAPQRLGHVINVPTKQMEIIKARGVALELCLSCNVLAKLTSGGFAKHHFGSWRQTGCPVALSVGPIYPAQGQDSSLSIAQTDDVGIFRSPLSNEYLLAARYFDLSREDLIELAKKSACAAFDCDARKRTIELIADFERQS